ncbi:MAG: DegT/DnrJ/EryC1/StrS family aminotransferase [bacterium]
MSIIRHSMPTLDGLEVSALSRTLQSHYIASGEEVAIFEKEVAAYCGVTGAVACSSGTAAIHLALLGLGIGKGMEVIIPSFSCASLYQAVAYTGAIPVLADCDSKTFLMTADRVKMKITNKTRAVILPHMFGLPADVDEMKGLGLMIIEDIAQAMGATYKGEKTGGLTEVAVTSFYATKMMTTGTGGMVLSDDQEFLAKVRDLNGVDKKQDLNIHLPYLMNDIQASMGRCQLKKLDHFIAKRKETASRLNDLLSSLPVETPACLPFREHIYFRYCIHMKKNIGPVMAFLNQKDIHVQRPIFSPLHLLNQKRSIDKRGDFPGSEEAWERSISLPIYPNLHTEEIERMASCLKETLDL